MGGYCTGAILLWVEALNVGEPLPRLWTRIRFPIGFSPFVYATQARI